MHMARLALIVDIIERTMKLLATAVASFLIVLLIAPLSDAQVKSARELRVELRGMARACMRRQDTECADACVEAMEVAATGSIDAENDALLRCKAGFTPVAEENGARQEGRSLQDGYQWMPDVEAVVTGPINRGRYVFHVTGRDADWDRYCRNNLRYSAKALQSARDHSIEVGTRVLLRHVKFSSERKITGQCTVGDIEPISEKEN